MFQEEPQDDPHQGHGQEEQQLQGAAEEAAVGGAAGEADEVCNVTVFVNGRSETMREKKQEEEEEEEYEEEEEEGEKNPESLKYNEQLDSWEPEDSEEVRRSSAEVRRSSGEVRSVERLRVEEGRSRGESVEVELQKLVQDVSDKVITSI